MVFNAEFVDNQICQIIIEPLSLYEASKRANGVEQLPDQLMQAKAAEEVVEELVPTAGRGPLVHSGSFESGCNEVGMAEFEHVLISRKFHRCKKESGEVVTVTIKWKEGKCGWKRR